MDEKIAEFVEDEVDKEKLVQVGIPDEIFCDPVTICNGTINNFLQLTPFTLRTFPFTAIGPDVNDFSITSDPGVAPPFTNAFTGPGGTVRVLAPNYTNPGWPTPNDGGFYVVDQIHVTDVNGNAVGLPAVQAFSCSGGNKGPVIIHDLRGTYNILFHIHKSPQPGVLCQ